MELQRSRWSRTNQIIAASVVFIVLVATVLIAQHPYTVYASTTSCTPSTATIQAHATIAVSGADTLATGSSYSITVTEDSAVSTYPTSQLGFAIQILPSDAQNIKGVIEFDRQLAADAGPLTPASRLSTVFTWKVPDTLIAGTYQFVPLVIAGGSELTLDTVTPATRLSKGGSALPYFQGYAPYLTEAVNGHIPAATSTAQQFAQYYIQNPSDTTQAVSVHWQLWAGAAGTIPLPRNEATYTQTIDPGSSLSRPFFIDTNAFETGFVEATLTAGTLKTTQWFRLTGAEKSGLTVAQLTQTGTGFGQIGKAQFGICMTAGTVQPGTTLHIVLADATQTKLLDKVLSGADLKTGEYQIRDYTLLAHWPLSITASTMVDGKEVSRSTNTYQP